jgi:hypothetical protein
MFLLQWGHSASAVETRCHHCRDLKVDHASMGPRHIGRGNWPITAIIICKVSRFNGATAYRPWKPTGVRHTAQVSAIRAGRRVTHHRPRLRLQRVYARSAGSLSTYTAHATARSRKRQIPQFAQPGSSRKKASRWPSVASKISVCGTRSSGRAPGDGLRSTTVGLTTTFPARTSVPTPLRPGSAISTIHRGRRGSAGLVPAAGSGAENAGRSIYRSL